MPITPTGRQAGDKLGAQGWNYVMIPWGSEHRDQGTLTTLAKVPYPDHTYLSPHCLGTPGHLLMAQKAAPSQRGGALGLGPPPEALISSILTHIPAPYWTRNSVLQPALSPLLKGTWVPKMDSKCLPHCGGEGRKEGRNTVSSQASQIPQVLARLEGQLNSVDVETEARSQQATLQRLEGKQGRPAS